MLVGQRADRLGRLQSVLRALLASDSLTARKLRQSGIDEQSALERVPFTSRQELIDDQKNTPPYGTNLTQPIDAYVRVVSCGRVNWLQTAADTERLARRWHTALEANDLRPTDRVLVVDGKRSCLDGLHALGVLTIEALPTHAQRARQLVEHGVTALIATPTDALRLAEAAAVQRIDVVETATRLVVLTGEPGGHVPSTRRQIEERFGARCVDLYARAELGVIGAECPTQRVGLHVGDDFVAELTDGELVLTDLAESGMPLVRYRTGDLVRAAQAACACGRPVYEVLGRAEDLLHVRGVDILPSTIENVVRRHPAVSEYQLEAYEVHGSCEVAIEIEPDEAIATEGDRARVAAEIAEDLRRSLGFRMQCEAIPPRSIDRSVSRPTRLHHR